VGRKEVDMHEWRSAKVRYEDPANIGAGGSRLYHLDGRNKLLARSRGVSAMFRAFLTYPTESVVVRHTLARRFCSVLTLTEPSAVPVPQESQS
jgi:hypothetical protein